MVSQFNWERVLILVKAAPLVGERQGEMVCCAGVTAEGQWRRQFPIHFRTLGDNKKFKRWHWIDYQWMKPRNDNRWESHWVQEDTISLRNELPPRQRANFLNPLIVPSTAHAAQNGNSLALVRPIDPKFSWNKKPSTSIEEEKRKFEAVARQTSMFDDSVRAYTPCPYEFRYDYHTEDGKHHSHKCLDWETDVTFYRWCERHSETQTLAKMEQVFGQAYPKNGVVFALGTHSQRPDQWLLVGVIRLDRKSTQGTLTLN
jgi:hypothetical protein